LILLAESANRTKKGGQELIGGLDVRVNRNHFGRQIESFQAALDLPFLREAVADEKDFDTSKVPFKAIFIRAPIVEKLLPSVNGAQESEAQVNDTVVAPSRALAVGVDEKLSSAPVEVLARLPGMTAAVSDEKIEKLDAEAGEIVAVRQGNVFGTSFHPELTGDPRIHVWWLEQVSKTFDLSLRPMKSS
jgi:5'-phosphate synthase pdxT subunit